LIAPASPPVNRNAAVSADREYVGCSELAILIAVPHQFCIGTDGLLQRNLYSVRDPTMTIKPLLRLIASMALFCHGAAIAACTPSNLDFRTVSQANRAMFIAVSRMEMPMDDDHPDLRELEAIHNNVLAISTIGNWIFDLLYLHSKMQSSADREEIAKRFHERLEDFRDLIENNTREVKAKGAALKSDGPRSQIKAVIARMEEFQQVVLACH
jgi:hypothetical protein